MNRDQKAAVVDEIAAQIRSRRRSSRSTTAGSRCRRRPSCARKLRDADATFRVVKNSLTERAADKAGAEALKALLEGPTALDLRARRRRRGGQGAQRLRPREPELLQFKGGLMDGARARRRRDQGDRPAARARGALRPARRAWSRRRSPASCAA